MPRPRKIKPTTSEQNTLIQTEPADQNLPGGLTEKTVRDLVKQKPHEIYQTNQTEIADQSDQSDQSDLPDLPKKSRRFGDYTEPGDNTRYLRMARVAMNLPPIDISDPRQVEQRLNDYFDFCEQNDRKPNMVGMANWLGVDKTTLNSWKRGEYRAETHSPVIKKAIDLLEELWVDYMQNGKINPVSGIFLAKNMFQYKNQQDVVVTPNNPMVTGSAEDVRRKYLESIPIEAEPEE